MCIVFVSFVQLNRRGAESRLSSVSLYIILHATSLLAANVQSGTSTDKYQHLMMLRIQINFPFTINSFILLFQSLMRHQLQIPDLWLSTFKN